MMYRCISAIKTFPKEKMDFYTITSQEILSQISDHCPEALSTYLHCINRVDKDGNYHFERSEVDVDMSENWMKFKNNIKKLARENLLIWLPIDDGVFVTLISEFDEDC